MIFKFRYCEQGGHTHVTLFAGRSEGSLGNAGAFVLRNEEWTAFKNTFRTLPISTGEVQFVEDEGKAHRSI